MYARKCLKLAVSELDGDMFGRINNLNCTIEWPLDSICQLHCKDAAGFLKTGPALKKPLLPGLNKAEKVYISAGV